MNIIFGDSINLLPQGAIVLELDTLHLDNDHKVKTYCVIEKLPENEYIMLEKNKMLHTTLLDQYRQKNWEGCRQLIKALHGQWDNELDSFYDILSERIKQLEQDVLPNNWDGSFVPVKKSL